ncbi:MAG: tetratricopeptide repeat protein [Deltaproteobacteria bacterium]|nr:tetratricopeptide repeat protein [Deltaproteobacteria bacterium]
MVMQRLFLGFIVAILVSACGAGPNGKDTVARKKDFTVGKWAYKRLLDIQESMEQEKYAEALEELEEMRENESLRDHEKALMWQLYSFVYLAQEKYDKSIDATLKCLALDALPESTIQNMRFSLGQQYLAREMYEKAIKTLEEWFAQAQKPSPNAHYIIAAAYVQQENYKKALPYATKAVQASKKPNESWIQLLLTVYFELKEYKKASTLLKTLVELNPSNKVYWTRLSAVYSELGDDRKSLAVLELAYDQHLLDKENELVSLAQFYLSQGMPMKGARILEKEMAEGRVNRTAKPMRILADCLLNARENDRALEILGEAAKLSKDGKIYLQKGQLHLQREEWTQARKAITKAIERGNLSSIGSAYLFLGIANYNENRMQESRSAFLHAHKHKDSEQAAERWLELLRM